MDQEWLKPVLTSAGRWSWAFSPHEFVFGCLCGGWSEFGGWTEAARQSHPASSWGKLRRKQQLRVWQIQNDKHLTGLETFHIVNVWFSRGWSQEIKLITNKKLKVGSVLHWLKTLLNQSHRSHRVLQKSRSAVIWGLSWCWKHDVWFVSLC